MLLEQVEDDTPVRDCELFLVSDPATQGKALVLAEQIRDQLEAAGSSTSLESWFTRFNEVANEKKPISQVLCLL